MWDLKSKTYIFKYLEPLSIRAMIFLAVVLRRDVDLGWTNFSTFCLLNFNTQSNSLKLWVIIKQKDIYLVSRLLGLTLRQFFQVIILLFMPLGQIVFVMFKASDLCMELFDLGLQQ
jgi:hypothetical protein